jgi:hypothetical protein
MNEEALDASGESTFEAKETREAKEADPRCTM